MAPVTIRIISLAAAWLGVAVGVTATEPAADADLARTLVEKADQIRFPAEAFQVDVDITSTSPDKEAEKRKYRILSKGNENTIVQTMEPAAERGQSLLMRGRDLWIFMPTLSQPVRLSLSQRLTGQVANGDLARANFAGDYNPKILRTEALEGEPHYVLELTAADRGVTYGKVLYWVKQANGRPVKAEFYSLSDRLLKTASYGGFKTLGGKQRPGTITIEDALKKGDRSVLEYSAMQAKDLPDKMFTKDALKRLE